MDLNALTHSWFGVTIENNNVVELNLQFNNFNGSLPLE